LFRVQPSGRTAQAKRGAIGKPTKVGTLNISKIILSAYLSEKKMRKEEQTMKRRLMMILMMLAVNVGLVWAGGLKANAAVCVTDPVVQNADDAGAGSLRDAIDNACPNSTITFARPLFDAPQTISTSIQLTIRKNLNIVGPGANLLTVRNVAPQSSTSRVFSIYDYSNPNLTVQISGMTISGGNVLGGMFSGGGGIANGGRLTVSDAVISNNSAGFNGGGIDVNSDYGTSSSLSVINSTFSGNSAGSGGAIFTEFSRMSVTNSTFSKNTANYGGAIFDESITTITNSTFSNNTGGSGGAILHDLQTTTIAGSTFSNNSARTGGSIYNGSSQLTINNSTISDSSAQSGGGISSFENLTINNSTVSNNRALTGQGFGGGIAFFAGTGTLNNVTIANNQAITGGGVYSDNFPRDASNSLIAGNTASASAPDYFGKLNSLGYNLIGNNGGTVITGDTTSNIYNVDAKIAPLADNGGPTLTHALLPGSPAIDAGNSTLTTDQRGFVRPIDFSTIPNAAGGNGSDIGAFEAQNSAPVAADDSYTTNEDTALNVPAPGVLGNDSDEPTSVLTATLIAAPTNAAAFTLNPDGSFDYTPNADFNGSDSFTYTVSDGQLLSNTTTVTITVNAVNDAPTANPDNKSTNEDTALTFNAANLTANDSAGPSNESAQTLIVTQVISTPNTHGQISLNNGQITYLPDANYNGAASFDYWVCDDSTTGGNADALCAVGTINVTVNSVNDNPTANNDWITVPEDSGATVINVLANDSTAPDTGETLTIAAVTQGARGTVVIINGGTKVRYTPNGNGYRADSFTYTISDGNGGSATATVTIIVMPVNHAPTITGGSISRQRAAGASNSQIAAVNDVDSPANTLSVTVNNSSTATVNGVTVSNIAVDAGGRVTANVAAACGASNASFNLKVTDSGGLFSTATLTVTVTRETVPPVLNPISNVTVYLPANSTATSTVVNFPLPTASDNCGGAVTVTTTLASGSVFQRGTTIVQVRATDAAGNTATSSFTVSVRYNFNGFLFPLRNDRINQVIAGVPVAFSFSLGAFYGYDIYAPGSPSSQPISCQNGTPSGTAETISGELINRPLYVPQLKTYSSIWNTQRAWRGTCRRLSVKLNDGTTHTVDFQFR
jgi:hypothetical protein